MAAEIQPFSYYLRQHIDAYGKSVQTLAAEVGLNSSSLSRLLSNENLPTRSNLSRLETVLGLEETSQRLEFFLSAGFAHPLIKNIDRWMDIVVVENSLFGSIEISNRKKDGFARDVTRRITEWSGEPITECEEFPQPLEFHPFLTVLVNNQNKDRQSLSVSMGKERHYVSSMIARKKIPKRNSVDNISSTLKLDKITNAKLFVAAGYAPQDLIDSYPWLSVIAQTVDVLNEPSISMDSKDQLGRIIAKKAKSWQTDPL